ncbi:MAG: EamA family transporter [Cytophagaceae bacterium]
MTLYSLREGKFPVIISFAAIYIIWGSTYLGIKVAMECIPPMLMAGFRFILAGGILYLIAKIRKEPNPTIGNLKPLIISSVLLLVIGTGGVVLAEKIIPSGLTALLITIEPLWIILLQWFRNGQNRPDKGSLVAIMLGIVGMYILTGPHVEGSGIDIVGVGLILLSTFSWALGSIYSIKANLPKTSAMNCSIQMLLAGAILTTGGTISGEGAQLIVSKISLISMAAFFYLVIFGSIIGLTAYSYLLKVVKPSSVSTYVYINPVIAIILGCLIGGESFTWTTFISSIFLIFSALIIRYRERGELTE